MEMPKEQQEFIFRSKLPDIYIPNHLPLQTYCFENITQFSTRPCLIDGATGETYTYADVELTARKVAAGLHKMGIQQGHVIMLLLPNSPEFVFAFLGALFRGAITTTANPFFTPPEIAKQARSSKATLIITKACYAEKVMEFAGENDDVRVICTDSPGPEGCPDFSGLAEANENELPAVEVQPEDVVVLPYSSGTTGLPKGVMLTHKSLVTSIAQQVEGENPNQYLEMDDVILCVLPLFHIYCLNLVLLCAIRARATLVIIPKFEINALPEVVQKYKVTIAPLVPPILLQIAKSPVVGNYDLSSVRRVISGAAPMGKDLEDAVRSKLRNATIGQGYGMTETALSMCLAFARKPFKTKSGSCGTVLRNAEMKIVNPDTGASLDRNQAGEICIRGDHIMKGYLDDPEATAKTIDKERWLHTGDIGYVDDDDELFIVDRLKELIKYKGFQVAPAELEALLIAHPTISDAAVIPMKDETAGEVPVAFVVIANGSEITEDEIKQYISKQVVFYKRIHRVLFTETIPKAPSGKILRKGLKEMLVAGVPN